MFYKFRSDIYAEAGVTKEPDLSDINNYTSFIEGKPITIKFPTPLVFESNFDRKDPPRSFVGLSIPVWSSDLVDLLHQIGVTNFECFEAIIEGDKPGLVWNNYFAVNILGRVAATDYSKSKYTKIMDSPNGIPFLVAHELVVNGEKVGSLDLFRLAETGEILVSERVVEALKNNPRPGGWGITAIPVEEA